MQRLAEAAGSKDASAVDVFRVGGDLVGVLKCTGNGNPIPGADGKGNGRRVRELTSGSNEGSAKMLKGLRVDEHAVRLLGMVEADAKLGRMSKPICVNPATFLKQDSENRCYSKAFTVEQGGLHGLRVWS